MFENLKTVLSQHLKVEEDLFQNFTKQVTIKQLKKKEIWEREGKISHHMAFLNSGAMKECYSKNGNEFVNEFMLPGDFIGNYISYHQQLPSQTYSVATESCELFVISFSQFEKLAEENPDIAQVSQIVGQHKLFRLNERSQSLLLDSPEERYDKLISTRPEVIERFPLYLIAEYLGIKPESLSRIRKKKIS